MGERSDNFKKSILQSPQQRNIFFAIGGVAVVALIVGFVMASKGGSKTVPGGANVAAVPNVSPGTGTSNSPEYNKKVVEANAVKASEAEHSGTGYIATPVNTDQITKESPIDLLEKENAKKMVEKKMAEEQIEKDRLENEAKELEKMRLANEAKSKAEAAIIAATSPQQTVPVHQNYSVQTKVASKKYDLNNDYILVATLSGMWKTKAPVSEYDYKGMTNESNNGSTNVDATVSDTTSKNTTAAKVAIPLASAGTVFNAILETAINSDEISPVMAKIVSGDFKGARLIGNIKTSGEKVIVEFNTLSFKGEKTSMKVNAVAIDPESSRTALTGDVNNHYFLRYGVMLAAAFLGGYSDALSQQNTTVTTDVSGATTVARGSMNSKQITQQALGSVGKELASTTKSSIQNLKPTIKVDSGIAIGVLLMEDLAKK
jgi:type IV secretory pathway VirB10-like protein